jgi:hypothetical protein
MPAKKKDDVKKSVKKGKGEAKKGKAPPQSKKGSKAKKEEPAEAGAAAEEPESEPDDGADAAPTHNPYADEPMPSAKCRVCNAESMDSVLELCSCKCLHHECCLLAHAESLWASHSTLLTLREQDTALHNVPGYEQLHAVWLERQGLPAHTFLRLVCNAKVEQCEKRATH